MALFNKTTSVFNNNVYKHNWQNLIVKMIITLLFLQFCVQKGGKCVTLLDGFYIESLICVVIGFIWLQWGAKKIQYIQSLDEKSWKLTKRKSNMR